MEEESNVKLVKVSELSSNPDKKTEQKDDEVIVEKGGDGAEEGGQTRDEPKSSPASEDGNNKGGGGGGGEVERKRKELEAAAASRTTKPPPTGGINIPGFLRPTRSKEKAKEIEKAGEEGVDLLEQGGESQGGEDNKQEATRRKFPIPKIPKIKFSIPFINKKKESGTDDEKPDGEEQEQSRKPKLLNAIKLPLPVASLLPKKLKPTKQETEVTAGLASMETLDDSNGSVKGENLDNMENVKLDTVEVDPEKAALEDETDSKWAVNDWQHHLRLAKQHKCIVGGVLLLLLLFIIIIIIAIAGPRVPTQAPIKDGKYVVANTFCGPVEGVLEEGAFVFRGVPYAVPPVGHLRWTAPQAYQLHTCWNGTYLAHNTTPSCWQIYPNGSIDGSEDCLTLDVYTPYVRYDAPLPVVVLIGAETLEGGSPGRLLPSSQISWLKDVVLVKPNFRLSSLGFLAAPFLSKKAYPHTSGNYGLHDIISALRWVQLNVQHFGGDTKQVTVLGYRAGATLVTLLTATHRVEKLFARAWLSSGSSSFPNGSLIKDEEQAKTYLEKLSCGEEASDDCLRNLGGEELLESIPDEWRSHGEDGWDLPKRGEKPGKQWLVIDGVLVREDPTIVWARQNVTVHLVLGTTDQSETTDKLRAKRAGWTEDDVVGAIKGSLIGEQNLTDEFIQRYNATPDGLSRAVADIRTVCPLYRTHKRISNSNFYLVTEVGKPGADVDAILGRLKPNSPNERRFISAIQRMFYHYVAHGAPPRHKAVIIGQDASPTRDLPHCSFWRQKGFENYSKID